MRCRLMLLILAAAAVLSVPTAAAASPPASKMLLVNAGSPLAEVQSPYTVPLHFSSSAREAVATAERSPILQALHRRLHPLDVMPYVWRGPHPFWYVTFQYRGKLVADANVSRSGTLRGAWVGLQALVPFAHGGWARILTAPWIFVPASLLFLLPFFDPRRLRRMAHLDAMVILAFLVSYIVLSHGHMASAIWLIYPPLVYLLIRLLSLGFGRQKPAQRVAPLLTIRRLAIGLPVLLGARVALSLLAHEQSDIGYESVLGAFRLLHHLPIYYNDPNHGDTYGPITYLAYVPFDLLFPWKNILGHLEASDIAAVFFDLATVVGLVLLGRRLRSGADGTRLGLLLGWAWAACPWTIIVVLVHTNDALVAMLTVFALVVASSPVVSGALLGLATAAKFTPAGLLPLLAAPRQRGVKRALVCVGAFIVIVATAIFSWLPPQGVHYFWQRTFGFQMTRPDSFSLWGLHPGLHLVQVAVEVLAVTLAGAVAFVPRERSLARVCALAGAVTIAVQLPAAHWYYYYIVWFLPFALVAILVPSTIALRSEEPAVEDGLGLITSAEAAPEPALAGV